MLQTADANGSSDIYEKFMVITVPMVNNGICISIKHGQGDFMRWTPLFIGLAMAGSASAVWAAKVSKEQALYNQIAQTVADYRQALLQFNEGDAGKQAAMAKSLEDLEDLANQCFKMKSCSKTQVISAYEQLIKDDDFITAEEPAALSPESLPALNTTVKLLGGGNMQLLTQFNEPVKAAIGNWLSGNRGFFMDSWVNYQYMRYLMAPEYEKAGLPEALLFGMMTKESGGKVHSVSKAGAAGPLQFMPSTGRRFGLDGSYGYDMRYDPQYAARANAEYMNERFEELNRSLEMAIAGYNGGEGRARRIYGERGGDFWRESVYKEWPAETRDYVPAVIAAAWLFMHGREFGLTFPKLDFTPSAVALQRTASINELTICLGNPANQSTWFRVLRNLNPRYEPGQNIPQGTQLRAPRALVASYQANCVNGERAELARSLVQARKAPVFEIEEVREIPSTDVRTTSELMAKPHHNQIRKYLVKPGDSLLKVSRLFDCYLPRLIKENDLSPPDYVIRPGQLINLVGCRK
jgi:membrane-bound lytic murein transglycosylase D